MDSNTRSISGAERMKDLRQKLYLGFLISSMKVINRPHCVAERMNEASITMETPNGGEI
jgi:hypothetical protein